MEMPRGPIFELPTALQGARWAPSGSAVLAVLVVVALVAMVFGARVWSANSGGAPVGSAAGGAPSGVTRGTSTLSRASPESSERGSRDGSAGVPQASGSPGGAASSSTGAVVHVVGEVASPGVYRMPTGARVGDAVKAAGGATRSAELTAVNLARVVVDGEQIVVPKPGQVVPGVAGAGTGGSGAGDAGAGAGGSAGSGGKVSINTADLAALDSLPGVGPVLAQRILDWRTEHGRFTSIEELGEVSGIGEKVLANLTPKVTL
ncbi:hypothetical protein N802_09845 [Knoellia sinensis KCTC 19936]|uniref:Helix-hairpin-helix DNA-binding motif class 1 domain-containing protein n=2 Tax=Knoellia TaxID=136099 RepID=A0A0A0J3F7_9MICO|nr:hypothetical protein N802_09845 [Knoellia sinensis KCTC 19936]